MNNNHKTATLLALRQTAQQQQLLVVRDMYASWLSRSLGNSPRRFAWAMTI